MIYIITGATHTGKTNLAQTLLETYHIPYLSLDHLKMGLIRSKQTSLTPQDDALLVDYLWPIIKEIIKTAIENKQNLIIEGCYIPFTWKQDFDQNYQTDIRYIALVMSEAYIKQQFQIIQSHANIIEQRITDELSMLTLIEDNRYYLEGCQTYHLPYRYIHDHYDLEHPTLEDLFD